MKKLLFLSIIALFEMTSANVFGQTGRGATPSIGSTHDYWVNGSATTHDAGHDGNKYTWWISKTASDLTQAETAGEFTPTTASDYNVPTDNLNHISLKWNPASAGQNYFLVVREEGNTTNGLCANLKAYLIQPKNDFAIAFTALKSDGASDDDVTQCAPEIKLTANGTDIVYNYGGGDYEFKLLATGIYSSWSFTNAFANVMGAGSNYSIEYKIGASGSWTSNTNNILVDANPAGTEVVYFRVVGTNDTFEGLDEQTMELTLSSVSDGVNKAKITNSTGADFANQDAPAQTQTVKARPNTTGISSN